MATEWSNAAEIELEPMPLRRKLEPLPEPPWAITMLGTIWPRRPDCDVVAVEIFFGHCCDGDRNVLQTLCLLTCCHDDLFEDV